MKSQTRLTYNQVIPGSPEASGQVGPQKSFRNGRLFYLKKKKKIQTRLTLPIAIGTGDLRFSRSFGTGGTTNLNPSL
ncbi:hypothetical protein [Flavobacterium sp.]|uniref:hypothetical protein n=1 Tax=Flavobacterium sp. TaxID=239 RepID=UPI002624D884|nr:hypothetical protein [Flavobacterium sp.]